MVADSMAEDAKAAMGEESEVSDSGGDGSGLTDSCARRETPMSMVGWV